MENNGLLFKAIKYLTHALDLVPDYTKAAIKKGDILFKFELWDLAIDMYEYSYDTDQTF